MMTNIKTTYINVYSFVFPSWGGNLAFFDILCCDVNFEAASIKRVDRKVKKLGRSRGWLDDHSHHLTKVDATQLKHWGSICVWPLFGLRRPPSFPSSVPNRGEAETGWHSHWNLVKVVSHHNLTLPIGQSWEWVNTQSHWSKGRDWVGSPRKISGLRKWWKPCRDSVARPALPISIQAAISSSVSSISWERSSLGPHTPSSPPRVILGKNQLLVAPSRSDCCFILSSLFFSLSNFDWKYLLVPEVFNWGTIWKMTMLHKCQNLCLSPSPWTGCSFHKFASTSWNLFWLVTPGWFGEGY